MRILVIIYEFPPLGGGGGRAAYDICKSLVARGHQVTVLTAHMQGLSLDEMRHGIHLIRIPSFRKESFRATFGVMLAYVLAGLWAGLRLIRRDCPDIIHTHFAVPSGALAWMLSVFTGIPYVLTAHLGDVPGGVPEKTGTWFRWIKSFTYPIWNRARKVVAVSEYTRQLALRHYKVKIDIIPNGADVVLLAPAEIKINHPTRIVFAGRFTLQKNPLAIVQVLAKIKDLNWSCSMLGDGPLLQEVKNEIEKHGLQNRSDLPGWVTPEDVLNKFSQSDILFMPSLSEGLPVVGVQALAKGLAFVVSDIGGFADLVDDGLNGYLVKTTDTAKFEKALRSLILNSKQLMEFRRNSLKKARHFDIVTIAEKYEMIFKDIVKYKS